jgi:hypothetical protein
MKPNAKWDPQLWESGRLKAVQLEGEIRRSSASDVQKSNMLHSLSKLTMFWNDAVYDRRTEAGTPNQGDPKT